MSRGGELGQKYKVILGIKKCNVFYKFKNLKNSKTSKKFAPKLPAPPLTRQMMVKVNVFVIFILSFSSLFSHSIAQWHSLASERDARASLSRIRVFLTLRNALFKIPKIFRWCYYFCVWLELPARSQPARSSSYCRRLSSSREGSSKNFFSLMSLLDEKNSFSARRRRCCLLDDLSQQRIYWNDVLSVDFLCWNVCARWMPQMNCCLLLLLFFYGAHKHNFRGNRVRVAWRSVGWSCEGVLVGDFGGNCSN